MVVARFEAYYNLHKKCLSARPIGGSVDHYQFLMFDDVKFTVQPAGRAKVLSEGRKNVHAFVRGELTDASSKPLPDYLLDAYTTNPLLEEVTYNPYKCQSFMFKERWVPIHEAATAILLGKRIFVPSKAKRCCDDFC